jgi:hypothetical protein
LLYLSYTLDSGAYIRLAVALHGVRVLKGVGFQHIKFIVLVNAGYIMSSQEKDVEVVRGAFRKASELKDPREMWRVAKEALDLLTLILAPGS